MKISEKVVNFTARAATTLIIAAAIHIGAEYGELFEGTQHFLVQVMYWGII